MFLPKEEHITIEQQTYEICRKSKITEYIQTGTEFFYCRHEKEKSILIK